MKKILTLLVTIAFLATFTSSHAAGYIGISFGSTSPDEDGFDDSNGYKLTAGYNANENVSLEASFTNLGEFDADDDLIAVLEFFSGFAIDDASIEVDGIEFAVLGHAPLSDTASIFGRVGIFMWDADFKIGWFGCVLRRRSQLRCRFAGSLESGVHHVRCRRRRYRLPGSGPGYQVLILRRLQHLPFRIPAIIFRIPVTDLGRSWKMG
jgi:hypothetical protein